MVTSANRRTATLVCSFLVALATATAAPLGSHRLPPLRGELTWTTPVVGAVRPPLLLDDGSLVFAATAPRELASLDRATGSLQWSWPPPADHDWPPRREPGARPLPLLFDGGVLRTVDIRRGVASWSFRGPVAAVQATPSGCLVRCSDGSLHVLSVDTGRERWSFRPSTADAVLTSVTPSGDTLYLTTRGGYVRALDADKGHQHWQSVRIDDLVTAPLLVTAHHVVVRRSSGRLAALNRRTGEMAWQFPFEGAPVFLGSIDGGGGGILLALRTGVVWCLSDRRGSVRWSRNAGGPIDDLVASARLVVVHRTDGGGHLCCSARRGTVLWRHRSKQPPKGTTAAHIVEGLVLFAAPTGLTARHGRTGQPVWHLPLTAPLTTFTFVPGPRRRHRPLTVRDGDALPPVDDAESPAAAGAGHTDDDLVELGVVYGALRTTGTPLARTSRPPRLPTTHCRAPLPDEAASEAPSPLPSRGDTVFAVPLTVPVWSVALSVGW